MRTSTLLAASVLLPASVLVTVPGPAAPIRCDLPGGRVLYRDPPCPAGATARELDGTVALAVEPAPAAAPPPAPAAGRERRSRAKERDKSHVTPARRESSPQPRASASPPAREPREKTRRNQALASERRFLRAGMTEAEVLASVGEPDMVSRAPRGVGRSARRSDTWVYGPAPGDPQTTTTLVFRDGAVAEVRRIVGR